MSKGKNGGKTKAWRKTPKQIDPNTGETKRYGRLLRNAMYRFNNMKSSGYPLLNGLLAWGGWISLKTSDTIGDVENKSEETVIAA